MKPKITDRAIHTMREIVAGRDRVFASDSRPPGMAAAMQLGYVARVGTERAMVTDTGRAFLRGLDHMTGGKP